MGKGCGPPWDGPVQSGPIDAVGDAGRKSNLVDTDGNSISCIQVVTGG
jgi:hypothetical protein